MDDICGKCPKEAAHYLSKIRRHNFLAHTIRDIEYEIHKSKNLSYHVTIRLSDNVNGGSAVFFYSKGCTIFIPENADDMGNKDIRLILAHELGHIWYNIDELNNLRGLHSPNDGEEVYAWGFAYCLLKNKSDDYKDGIGTDEYIYRFDELEHLFVRMVKTQRPDLYGKINDFLKKLDSTKQR